MITVKALPVLVSGFIWAFGITLIMQFLSQKGIVAVAAYNIASSVNGLFANVFGALGVSLLIIVGQHLGAGNLKAAKDTNRKMIAFSVWICSIIGMLMILSAQFIPHLYHTSKDVQKMASGIIVIMAGALPTPQGIL